MNEKQYAKDEKGINGGYESKKKKNKKGYRKLGVRKKRKGYTCIR